MLAPLTSGMGSIFMLHHVCDMPNDAFSPNYHLSVSPKFLDRMISNLKNKGVEFITMDEVATRLEDPERFADAPPFAAVTLDDGYRDNLINAVPVFHKHDVPFLIYIAPGLIEGETTLWWEDLERIIRQRDNIHVDFPYGRVEFDTRSNMQKRKVYNDLVDHLLLEIDEETQRKIVSDLSAYYHIEASRHVAEQIMNWDDIHQLSKDPLCGIGAHTIGHFALAKLDENKALFEMEQCAQIIKAEIGVQPEHFAYPYGFPEAASKREFKLAEECGFKTAVTTRHGMVYAEHSEHIHALPRVSVNGHHQSMRYIDTLLSGVPGFLKNKGGKLNVE